MRRLLRFTIAVLLCTSAVPALAVAVSGTVRNESGNSRLAGMIVEAYDETGNLQATGTTDATGFYLLNLPAGRYRILAYDKSGQYATSFGGNAESFETSPIVEITAATTIDFNLQLAAFVSGYVTSGSGTPRAGLTVAAYNLSGTRRGFTKTDATGFFFLALPPGPYRIVAYDESGVWATVFYSSARSFAEAKTLTLASAGETANIGLVTAPAARINGKVIDAAAAVPLADVLVYAYTVDGALVATDSTDALGNFSLSVPAGSYRLVAADPSRTFASEYLGGAASFASTQPLSVSTGEQRNGVNFAMRRGAVVEGRVTDSAGASLAGVTVGAYNVDGTLQTSTVTNADGTYVLAVHAGEVIVGAADPTLQYASQFHLLSNTFADATPLELAVGQTGSSVDFALAAAGRVRGTVRTSAGSPVAGVTVAAYDEAGVLVSSGVSGADGSYKFGVPAGTYRLVAFDASLRYAASFAGGAASFETSAPISVAAGVETFADFVVRSGLRVNGTVVSRDGTPLSGIEIRALDSAGNSVGGTVSSGGAFSLVLLPGDYRFIAEDSAGRHRTVYYRDASSLGDATVVTVSSGQLPPPLQFVLDPVSRRRSVRH